MRGRQVSVIIITIERKGTMREYFKKIIFLLGILFLMPVCTTVVHASEMTKKQTDPFGKREDLIEINIDLDSSAINDDVYEVDSESQFSLTNETYSWKQYATDFYYNQLDSDEQVLYDRLDEMCMEYLISAKDLDMNNEVYTPSGQTVSSRRATLILFSDLGLTKEQATNVYWIFNYSNPQYFFLSNALGRAYNGSSSYIAPYFYEIFSQGSERMQYANEFQNTIDSWKQEIGTPSNYYELQKDIHDIICRKVEYANSADTYNPYYQSAVSAICQKGPFSNVTVCAGYAKTFSLLANSYGLDTIEVTSSSHAWNKIYLFDQWYNVDCTWDDQVTEIINTYFDRSDNFFVNSGHSPENIWTNYMPTAQRDFDSATDIKMNFVIQPIISTYTCDEGKMVSIKTNQSTNAVFYTLDGQEPSVSYNQSFLVSKDTTVRAKAVATGGGSSIASLQIGLKSVDDPVISIENGKATISCSTSGVKVFYTNDGSEPTERSELYNGTFRVNDNQVIKAIAFRRGYKPSKVVSNIKTHETTLNGMCWTLNDTEIAVGVAYASDDPNIQFRWQSYNLDTNEWKEIADWNGSNWATWRPRQGNYWLHVEAKTTDGKITDDTICFQVSKDYSATIQTQGTCWIVNDTSIDVGVAYQSVIEGTQFRWQSYNLDTQQWTMITDWNHSNWTTWRPRQGNYWLHVEAENTDGSSAEETICFSVGKDYTKTLSLGGTCWIVNDTGIDVGVDYQSAMEGTQFRWQSYNLDTQQWTTIADWNSSNWATWKPEEGNYWLHVEAQNADGCMEQETICFRVDCSYE